VYFFHQNGLPALINLAVQDKLIAYGPGFPNVPTLPAYRFHMYFPSGFSCGVDLLIFYNFLIAVAKKRKIV